VDIAGSPYGLAVQLPDRTPPSVTIDQAASQPDPTRASPILFTVVFSEPVSGFAGSGVSFTGSSVGGSLVASVSGSGAIYTVSVTGMSGAGTVVASVPTGAASDAAGNPSLSSTSADNVVTFDDAAPLVAPAIADALSNGGDGDGVLELAEKLTFAYGVTDGGTGVGVTAGCIDDPTPADGCGAGSPVADGGVRQDLPAGAHAFCVYAADAASNAATVCRTFSVLYSFTGFFPPIDAAPVVNVFKAGKAMPVKWQITDVNGVGIADPASFVAIATSPVSCSDWSGSPRSTIFRRVKASPTPLYRGQGQWQLNWEVPASYAGTCQLMQLTLADAGGVVAQRTARFQFK